MRHNPRARHAVQISLGTLLCLATVCGAVGGMALMASLLWFTEVLT